MMKRICALATAILIAVISSADKAGCEESGPVFIIRIDDGVLGGEGMVDYWLVRFLDRNLRHAERAGAKAVIIELETNGGLVTAAFKASEEITESKVRTIAFVSHRAFSAGALLTLACDEIYMLKGSTMGAALPIALGPDGAVMELDKDTREKTIRSITSAFRAAAEQAGHNPALAMAMVDPDLEVVEADIDGKRMYLTRDEFIKQYTQAANAVEIGIIVKAGELFVPTTADAVKYGLAKGEVESLDELINVLGYSNDDTVRMEAGWLDNSARFLAGPVVSGLLILIAIIGLGIELKTPGFGAGGATFILALGLYLWGKFFAGAATPIEIALFFVGLALLAVELFLIPGFGIVGISGVILILGSIVLTALPPDVFHFNAPVTPLPGPGILPDILSVFIPLAAGLILLFIIISTMDRLPFAKRLVLENATDAELPETPSAEHFKAADIVGKMGITITVLRPAGRAEINGHTLDVVTSGDFLPEGTKIKVLEISGNRIVVERA